MDRRIILLGAAVVVGATIAGGVAVAASGDVDEGGVTGPAADAAISAALAATGGGRANSVELDGEDGATWEVEVTKPDGATVDVRLDEAYAVVVIEGDSEAHDSDD